MEYKCRISDSQGVISNGIFHADGPAELAAELSRQNLFLLSCKKVSGRGKGAGGNSYSAVLEFTQGLSLMIQSGLSLKDSFDVARGLYTKGHTARLVEDMAESIRKGDSFSQAVNQREQVFPSLYRGMVRVGERVGQLDRVLPNLASWMREDKELKDKIFGALLYPALVLSMVFAGVLALLFFFVPKMEEMLSYGGDQSALNQAIASAHSLLVLFIAIPLCLLFVTLSIKVLSRKYDAFALAFDQLKMHLPFIASFFMNREMLSLTFALTVLTQCKVPLEESLLEGAEVLNNVYLKENLLKIQKRLIKGENLSGLLSHSQVFPAEFSRWIAVGEKIGKVDQVFAQLKDYYGQEMKKKLNRISSLAEPAVILLLGLVLLMIILKIILPMLTLYGGLG